MAVPKKRTTSASQGQRRSHQALKNPSITLCPNCGKTALPHIACKACGFYRGRQVLKV